MDDCIFCKIINSKIPSKRVFENDWIYAFEDINPQAPIHVLVVPKKHVESINGVKEEDFKIFEQMFLAIKAIAANIGIAESGYRVVINTGPQACQTIFHLHAHLLGGTQLGGSMVG